MTVKLHEEEEEEECLVFGLRVTPCGVFNIFSISAIIRHFYIAINTKNVHEYHKI